ncbi:MAG: hypothetical protein WCA98_20120 [Candidatus Acidiferrales bacterium]
MRKLLLLIYVLGLPCASWAQSNSASWANLSTLQAGERIQVVQTNSTKISGTFSNVSDAAITLQEQSGPQTIQRQDVRSVKLAERAHRLRNILIGGAVGAGVGAGIGAGAFHGCTSGCIGGVTTAEVAAVAALGGFLGGAVVGAFLPSHKTIYRAPAH